MSDPMGLKRPEFWWRRPHPHPEPPPEPPVTLVTIERQLVALMQQGGEIVARLDRMEKVMATQFDTLRTSVQNLSGAIDGVANDVNSVDQAVQDLKNRNPQIDVSDIQAAVDAAQAKLSQVDQHVQAITSAAGPTPSPSPAPTPDPVPAPVPDPGPAPAPGSRR